ncbi:MAG: hypothetical protein LC674_01955, partial [Actinobacteria bacterium]|nr:hypothetical protein [Actinomycetota bacterium]
MAHTGGIPVCQLGDPPQLIGVESPKRNLDPNHLHARLPLAVNAVLEPERLEDIARHVPVFDAPNLALERLDLFTNVR